jgi:serine/threonine protein phosphatase PrpC
MPPSNDEADHAITRAVGGEDTLLLDVRRDRVRPGDRYLVCSDGLTRELNDAQIGSILAEGEAARCVDALLAAVLATPARDNVTAVIVDADQG